ncbi:MAG TPA: hypothetical protein VF970_07270 [Gemmatimonadales bacterium]
MVVEESFGLDVVESGELEVMQAEFGSPVGGGQVHSLVHCEAEAYRTAQVRPDDVEDAGLLSGFWDWVGSRPQLVTNVIANLTYDQDVMRAAVPLPLEMPKGLSGFDAIEGVSLVKRAEGGNRILYEVRLMSRPKQTALTVRFRTELSATSRILLEALDRAVEIANLALVPITPEAARG